MHNATLAAALSAALLVANATLAGKEEARPSVGPAIDALPQEALRSLPYMCECEFFYGPIRGDASVFATRSGRKVALAVIENKLLTLEREGRPGNPRCLKQTEFRERWVSGWTAIVLKERVTGAGAEACWYRGTMSVAIGGRVRSIPISGACGC